MQEDKLKQLNFYGHCFNVVDPEMFKEGLELIKKSLFDKGATFYASDNIITWNRNYSFARQPFYQELLQNTETHKVEKSIIWRTYISLYLAKFASHSMGDFVELGCHSGHTAHQVLKTIDLHKLNKKYYLYDLFEWNPGDSHPRAYGHGNPDMHAEVVNRFENFEAVQIIKGKVPDSFTKGFPEKISFCHIDMNNSAPEVAALNEVMPRLQSGGVVLLDDYGWWGYSAQKIALDPIVDTFGFEILELPTGQGVILKP